MSERMPAKEDQTDLTLNIDIGERKESPYLGQQVMEDPEARRIFFEMMEKMSMLSGHPDNEDVLAIRKKLDEARIPYFYSKNYRLPRPMLVMQDRINAGQEAIETHIASLNEN